MTRDELVESPEYWLADVQMRLCACAEDFMGSHGVDADSLAAHLGTSRRTVSRLLNLDYDQALSRLVRHALAMGYAPIIKFRPIEQVKKSV